MILTKTKKCYINSIVNLIGLIAKGENCCNMKKLDEIKSKLKKHGQEHLLLFYDKMNDSQKEELLNQIENIDFDLMDELYESTKRPLDLGNITVEPI